MIVVLDLDGTLASVHLDLCSLKREVDEHFARRSVDVTCEVGIVEKIALGATASGDREAAGALLSRLERMELEAASRADPIPGVREALERLRERGHPLAVLSRNCRAAVDVCLLRVGLADLLDAVVTRNDAPPKPLPDGLVRIVRSLGGGPAVMVGDGVFDMRAGRAAGVVTVGVLSGTSPREELEGAGADHVIPDVAHLPELVERLSAARGARRARQAARPHGNV